MRSKVGQLSVACFRFSTNPALSTQFAGAWLAAAFAAKRGSRLLLHDGSRSQPELIEARTARERASG